MDAGPRKIVFSTFPRAGSRQQVSAKKRVEVLMWGIYENRGKSKAGAYKYTVHMYVRV